MYNKKVYLRNRFFQRLFIWTSKPFCIAFSMTGFSIRNIYIHIYIYIIWYCCTLHLDAILLVYLQWERIMLSQSIFAMWLYDLKYYYHFVCLQYTFIHEHIVYNKKQEACLHRKLFYFFNFQKRMFNDLCRNAT